MKFTLRPYQKESVDLLRTSLISGYKRPILCLPTGAGKTITFSFLAEMAQKKNKRVGVVCHRTELVSQARDTMKAYGLNPLMLTFGMVQTYVRSPEKIPEMDLCIIDECFISGTIVSGKNIEDIKAGDLVYSFNHATGKAEKKRVIETMKRKPKGEIYKINIKDGGSIICTENHPIYVINKGYVPAKDLKLNDKIYGNVNLSSMRKRNEKRKLQNQHVEIKTKQEEKGSFELLQETMRVGLLRQNAQQENDGKQSYEINSNEKKSERNIKRNRTQAEATRRERKGDDRATGNITKCAGHRMGSGMCSNYRERVFTISLQNRYCESKDKNCNRGRRGKSWNFESTESRSEKRPILTKQRVESIEVFKQSDFERIGDGFVYNIQVEDNENYFANGILVHNCHIGNFRKFVELLPSACQVIGATATPLGASKKKPLRDVFDDVVCPVQINDLIESGYLSVPEYHIWEFDDTKLTKDFNGEFTSDSQAKVFSLDNLQEAVDARIGKTLVFTSSIKATLQAAEMIPGAFMVHSKMTTKHREAIVKEYKASTDGIMVNCGILTAGFDDPSIETVIIYRATTSVSLWLQMVGRGSRIIEGRKNKFYIMDLGNNRKRLLAWEANRNWKEIFSLQGKKLKDQAAPMKECVECSAVIYASSRKCPYCEAEQPVKTAEEQKADKVTIISSYSDLPDHLKKPYDKMTVAELEERAQYGSPNLGRPFKTGWILSQIRGRENAAEEIQELASLKGYKKGWTIRQLETIK